MRENTRSRTEEMIPSSQKLNSFAKDVLRGRIKDVTALLKARRGPVNKEEIDWLSTEMRKLDRPYLPAMQRVPNPDSMLADIAAFGQRRKVLADYRLVLHEILQLQHRTETLRRSKERLTVLNQEKRSLAGAVSPDLDSRIAFWTDTVTRDTQLLNEARTRLETISPISLKEIDTMISVEPNSERAYK